MTNKKEKRYSFKDSRRPTPELELRMRAFDVNCGDLFTLEEFVERVKDGSFIDYDGSGYYAFKVGDHHPGQVSNQVARPSEILKGNVDCYWTHVAWYNK